MWRAYPYYQDQALLYWLMNVRVGIGMRQHIGIYSGTFDPVHYGHIAFCLEALKVCGLEKIYILPERMPRGKAGVSSMAARMALLTRAIAAYPELETIELDEERFTVSDTLPKLERLFPDKDMTLLVGSDVVYTFLYRWTDIDVLLQRVSLAIGMRQGTVARDVIGVMETLERAFSMPVTYRMLTSPHAHMASSLVRAGVLADGIDAAAGGTLNEV